jgi:hypothetical protein
MKTGRCVSCGRATCRWAERFDLVALREERGAGSRAQG